MRWLLWKDYRHNRLIVFTVLFLLLLPHLVALGVLCWGKVYWPPGTLHWNVSLAIACLYSIGISGISLALIGGNAIAGERVDRSAEFLFALPIPRRKLLASKFLLALVVASVPWLTNLYLLCYLARTMTLPPLNLHSSEVLKTIAVWDLVAFCVSWCVTSFISSATFATLAGLLAPYVVLWNAGLIIWSSN